MTNGNGVETRLWRVTVVTRATIEVRAVTSDEALAAVSKMAPCSMVEEIVERQTEARPGEKLAAVDARGEPR